MKTRPICLASLVWLLPLVVFAGSATIRLDVDRVLDQVDPRIYGVSMEPIGRNRPDAALQFPGPFVHPDRGRHGPLIPVRPAVVFSLSQPSP